MWERVEGWVMKRNGNSREEGGEEMWGACSVVVENGNGKEEQEDLEMGAWHSTYLWHWCVLSGFTCLYMIWFHISVCCKRIFVNRELCALATSSFFLYRLPQLCSFTRKKTTVVFKFEIWIGGMSCPSHAECSNFLNLSCQLS